MRFMACVSPFFPEVYYSGGRRGACGQMNRKRMSELTNTEREELEQLRKQKAVRESQDKKGISFKVSEKGGVSVYGLGRFPVTLYQEQWSRLFSEIDNLKTFIEENKPKLKVKE